LIDNKVLVLSAAVAAFLLIGTIVVLGVRISNLSGRLEDNQIVYKAELDKTKLLMDEISQNLQIMSSSTNEVRRSLNLPAKQLIQQKEVTTESEEPDVTVSFFDALRFMVQNDDLEVSAAAFSRFIDEKSLVEYFYDNSYELKRVDLLQAVVIKDNVQLLSFKYNGEERSLNIQNITGDSLNISTDDNNLFSKLDKELMQIDSYFAGIQDLTESLETLLEDDEVQEILTNRNLKLKQVDDKNYTVCLIEDDSIIGSLGQIQNTLLLNSNRFLTIKEFKTSLLEYLLAVSNKTETARVDEYILKEMEKVFSDEGFKVLLESNNCKSSLTKREDDEFIYYDILTLDNTVKGTFALQKEFGEVLLLSGDGKYLKSLKMFTGGNDLKSLISENRDSSEASPYVFDDSSENFLVVGTHEHNADTMIIVNANNKTGKLNMISIPRDLYYKGNKINNIYKSYGPERLCAELSEITGMDIKKYISIDMFAFIDVVNILGGLDVTLDEDLIDPTYKVKNNGVWSTLYYRKGTHHLDGVAALRVARSRHGSDDFDRSKRQQLVIKAVLNSMKSLDAGDMDKFYEFLTSISSYISTNLSIGDIVKNYLMYKDNEIADPNIINTDNILYATYSNMYLLSKEEQKSLLENDDFYKGLWIVLPNNNDWNLIKKHIEKILRTG
jgi:LCP family protein required for cell wall assembly